MSNLDDIKVGRVVLICLADRYVNRLRVEGVSTHPTGEVFSIEGKIIDGEGAGRTFRFDWTQHGWKIFVPEPAAGRPREPKVVGSSFELRPQPEHGQSQEINVADPSFDLEEVPHS